LDRKENIIPQKDVPVAAIRSVEAGENAIRDPTLVITVTSSGGETRQMVLTFPQKTGAVRKRERDEWAKELRVLTATSVQKVIRKVIPVIEKEPRRKAAERAFPSARADPPARTMADDAGDEPIPPSGVAPSRQAPEDMPADGPLPYGSFCTKCGNRLSPGSAFCNRCGTRVVVVPEKARPVQRVQEPEEPGETVATRSPRPAGTGSRKAVAQPRRRSEPEPVFGRAGPQGEGHRRGLLSRIFPERISRKKATPPPDDPHPRPAAKRPSSGLPKKVLPVIAAIAIIIVVAAIAVFVLPGFLNASPSSDTETPAGDSGPVATAVTTTAASSVPTTAVVVRTTAPITIPSDGVYVKVSYIGAWKGTYGETGSVKSVSRSGTALLEIEDASGTVEATFQKDDTSTKGHELLVEIYKNGTLLQSGSTTDYQGQVSVLASV
jgi:hypothetical protein